MTSASNVELLNIMFKDIAAIGELAWTPTSNMLPDDIERRKEGLSEMSTDSSSPDNDDDSNEVETPNPKQPLNPLQLAQDKGKNLALPSSTQGKGKKGGATIKVTQQLSCMCHIVESRNSVFLVELGSSICNVMEHVYTLDGIEKGSELFFMEDLSL
ncbi:uncharacterized protein LOC115984809 [Quercus lobata]|uniref:uncharacterized protein LOC115984809 n=1 Tax=Quercus lobata TaxID=97700 RepID=UPI001245A266|nr:uncharacterized protein LOC115984809 [Quercus lobata]